MKKLALLGIALLVGTLAAPAHALDLTGGRMSAVPVRNGQPPVINGDLKDWDLSASEPIWISPQTAKDMNATVALMYDDNALYVAARIALPNRRIHNPNNPVDAFWGGDVLELRVGADPALPYPLNRDVNSDRVGHITLWKNSETGKDYLHIGYGVNIDKGSSVNPPGSQVILRENSTKDYVIEARVPWSALHVPGGKNPFAAGQRMTAVWSPHWGGERQVAALYRENPGSFSFSQPQTWGQVEFSATGNLKPRHENMAQLLARFASEKRDPARVGVPIVVDVAEPMKVSVNVFGPRGEVLRELVGGFVQPRGKLTLRWDGKDQWGHPLPPGRYRWGAYFHKGLRARYVAGVGKTAHPYYDTLDNKGGWGADHSDPIDVAADATGLYFLWPVAEAGRAVVKTDYAGSVLWRRTPFLGGGWGPFYAVAADGKYVYIARGDGKPGFSRLDAGTGQLLTWGAQPGAPSELPISDTDAVNVPASSSPLAGSDTLGKETSSKQPETVGLAVRGREAFASVYSKNVVQVLNTQTGKPTRALPCPGPRGVALDKNGDLYVVSFVAGQTPRIVRFAGARGAGRAIVSTGLVAPWDVAVDDAGRVYVSDNGRSQQIKVFAPNGKLPNGKLLSARGKPGGRPWAGAYDGSGFRNPAGVAIDSRGGLLVAESAIPKIMSRFRAADGALIRRWFGAPQYWNGTWADPADPRKVYYQLSGGFARADLSRPGFPPAYWHLSRAGLPDAGNFDGVIPSILVARNGLRYLVGDVSPNGVALIQGDKVLPVAHFLVKNRGRDSALNGGRNTGDRNFIEVWQDANGDHHAQPGEVTRLDTVAGKPLPFVADWFAHTSMMAPNGDYYLTTQANQLIKIPAVGFLPNGAIRWNVAGARYVVPAVLPAQGDNSYAGPRGQVGLRVDGKNNIYTVLSATTPELTPQLRHALQTRFPNVPITHWGAYATKELREAMKEGLGHTAESNAVKFVKYAGDGRILWMAGRKATAAARPGELYHFWALAGLVGKPGNEYVAAASEWGPFYFYTHDGFFVDTLMNDPGLNPPPGPYTFGSETGAGRVQHYPERDQVWAYAVGMAYVVDGFKNGRVDGERRVWGTVRLDKVYETDTTAAAPTAPLQIVPLAGNPLTDASAWQNVPSSTLARNNNDLATAQIGYDANHLYARIHVSDPTPGENSADTVATAFKGGDTAGVVLGPSGQRGQPGPGDIRLMVARINGQPRLIAMKAVSAQTRQPFDYFTPSSGHVSFDFVGEVPNARVTLTLDADGKGYTAAFAVPRTFLEFDLQPGTTLSGDIEVRLSGAGPRGLQATSRNYLFTPRRSETTMTDDVPTEARLYPLYWGSVEVK